MCIRDRGCLQHRPRDNQSPESHKSRRRQKNIVKPQIQDGPVSYTHLYNALKEKSQNLNALVEQLVIIQTEDSLQKVALMKKPERDALIAGIINKIIKEENEGRTSQYADRYNMGQYLSLIHIL